MSYESQMIFSSAITMFLLLFIFLQLREFQKQSYEQKTWVEFTCIDRYKEFYIGDRGYISGYVVGGDQRPYVCIVMKEKVVMAQTNQFKVIKK